VRLQKVVRACGLMRAACARKARWWRSSELLYNWKRFH
jgi:hypothetical protein